jgi:hypothetical protein
MFGFESIWTVLWHQLEKFAGRFLTASAACGPFSRESSYAQHTPRPWDSLSNCGRDASRRRLCSASIIASRLAGLGSGLPACTRNDRALCLRGLRLPSREHWVGLRPRIAQDCLPSPEASWPISSVIAALTQPRVSRPPCVLTCGRHLYVASSALTCCPHHEASGIAPIGDADHALTGARYWDCALRSLDRDLRACCALALGIQPKCVGPEAMVRCPSATCSAAAALVPVALAHLRSSTFAEPQLEEITPAAFRCGLEQRSTSQEVN